MPKIFAFVILFACLALGVASTAILRAGDTPSTQPAATQPTADSTPVNTKCPVSGEDVDLSHTIVYKGKTIAFCCPDCEKAFNKDPEKYVAKMK
jgi:YHS domain-containing protein